MVRDRSSGGSVPGQRSPPSVHGCGSIGGAAGAPAFPSQSVPARPYNPVERAPVASRIPATRNVPGPDSVRARGTKPLSPALCRYRRQRHERATRGCSAPSPIRRRPPRIFLPRENAVASSAGRMVTDSSRSRVGCRERREEMAVAPRGKGRPPSSGNAVHLRLRRKTLARSRFSGAARNVNRFLGPVS